MYCCGKPSYKYDHEGATVLKCLEVILVLGLEILPDPHGQPDSIGRQVCLVAASKLNYRDEKAEKKRGWV